VNDRQFAAIYYMKLLSSIILIISLPLIYIFVSSDTGMLHRNQLFNINNWYFKKSLKSSCFSLRIGSEFLNRTGLLGYHRRKMFEKSGSRTQVTRRSSSRANHYANCSYNWLEYVDYWALFFISIRSDIVKIFYGLIRSDSV
jgi:hypothetical protein